MPNTKEALPTQKFIEIDRIENGTVILNGGGLRQILMVSGINFDLKSEEEQGLIISLFQGFLNSLNFSVQIFIHSRKVNIEGYLANLEKRESQESNELLKNQIVEYREFIRAFVSENAIMSKSYFVVVPYDPVQLSSQGEAFTSKIFGLLKKKGVESPNKRLPEANATQERVMSEHVEQLTQRSNQVISGLNQMNLRAIPLNDAELVELFYNLYNPEAIEKELPSAEATGN
jgi:type IV secretory pathway VirB4 component